ncbi:hypothetical protein JW796_00655, partial [Candidatus Dojkabacteria bacterium]|nr:hypothetical protein [Candidatus Dojkabacteria bacterium]
YQTDQMHQNDQVHQAYQTDQMHQNDQVHQTYQTDQMYQNDQAHQNDADGNIDGHTSLGSLSQETEKIEGGEYSIGTQELGDITEEFQITDDVETQQPSWLTKEQDIDVNEAARPVTAEGEEASTPEVQEKSDITQPHGFQPVSEDSDQ